MKTTVFVLVALLLVSSVALAGSDPRKVENAIPGTLTSRTDCVSTGYDCYMEVETVAIPDNEPAGVLLGPIPTTAGDTIQDVLLYINIEHTWIGDLIIKVHYSHDCTDGYDADGSVLCRHTLDGCEVDGCCGCSGDLNDWYGFDDTAPSIEDGCEPIFTSGCYGPDYDSILLGGLTGFDGLATGGCFWLHVTDGAGGDVGAIYAWEVCVLPEPIATSDGALDIKPGSCPNPFNVKAQGRLPVAVLGTDTFDVMDIDVSTVMLAGVAPIWDRYGDVATPVGDDAEPCECNELGPDGYTDLKLKFMRQDIVDVLCPYEDGDDIELTLTGELMDGTPFSLTDCIWILDKGRDEATLSGNEAVSNPNARENDEPDTWGTIKALYR